MAKNKTVKINGETREIMKVGMALQLEREDIIKAQMAGVPEEPREFAKRKIALSIMKGLMDRDIEWREYTKDGEKVIEGSILIVRRNAN